MKKLLVAAVAFATLSLSACGMSTANSSPTTTTSAPALATACSAVISTGEASHAAYADWIVKSADAKAALDTMIGTPYDSPNRETIKNASDEAAAARSLALSTKTSTSAAYQQAKDSAPQECRALSTLDLEFLAAYGAIEAATPATLQAAQDQLAAVQAKWDKAKTS